MPNQCLAGFVQIVTLCAELFEGPPRQATLSGSNTDRSRNYNGPCGWSEMWVIASVRRAPCGSADEDEDERAEAARSGPAPMRTHGTTTGTSDDGFRRMAHPPGSCRAIGWV